MDEFCPSCGANVGVGTISIIGCPLCGYGHDRLEGLDDDLEDMDDDFNDEPQEKESRQKVLVRSRTGDRVRLRTRTKKKPAKKG